MLLVPKQLRRSGMTGNVPYYGGRLSPAQAYAASRPPRPRPGPAATPAATPGADPLPALQQLLDTGVITAEEFQDLRARVDR